MKFTQFFKEGLLAKSYINAIDERAFCSSWIILIERFIKDLFHPSLTFVSNLGFFYLLLQNKYDKKVGWSLSVVQLNTEEDVRIALTRFATILYYQKVI